MAVAGPGTPRLGTRFGFPESLTQLLAERNEPVLASEVAVVGPLISPYLGRACERCWVLASLLLSEEDEALGMLVLLRPPDWPAFRGEDRPRARVLADLASLALSGASRWRSRSAARERRGSRTPGAGRLQLLLGPCSSCRCTR